MTEAETKTMESINVVINDLLSDDDLKAIALENGFKVKDQGNGVMDLNPYVYDAMREVMRRTIIGLVLSGSGVSTK